MNWFQRVIAAICNIRYDAATFSTSRSWIPGTPQDARLDFTKCTRETLVNLSRHCEANHAIAVKLGLIFEQYVVGEDGLPVSPATSSPNFNKEALDFWNETEPFLDIGSPQGFRSMTGVAGWRWFFDGECHLLKTFGESRFPRLQLIESHRITTPDKLSQRDDIVDGVQIDTATGRPLNYFVADGSDAKAYRLIPASALIPIMERSRARMHRGVPMLAAVLNDMQDLYELQRLEMLAAKDAAEITNVIKNQAGELPASIQSLIRARSSGKPVTTSTDTRIIEDRSAFYQDKVGGRTIVLRNGDSMDQFKSERPSVASQQYWDFLTSKICAGVGISKLLVYPWSMQGTVTRSDLDCQAAFFRTRSAVMIKAVEEAYRYVIGWAINNNKLKNAPKDWWKVTIRPPRGVNVDVGRNSDAMLRELAAGATTFEDIYGPLGDDWRERIRQRAAEAKFIRETAKEFEIEVSEISQTQEDKPERIQTEPREPIPADTATIAE